MDKKWLYFQNPFISATGRSFKKAFKLSVYTNAQLNARQSDAFFGPLFTMYNPLHLALADAYNTWKAEGGSQNGATLSFAQMLKTLSPSKINAWDLAMMNVYAKGSPQYVSIFPNGHKPFQTGERDQRVAAVKQLYDALITAGTLTATADDVSDFYKELTNARNEQQGKLGNTSTNSSNLSEAVKAAMSGLYKILGACINRFADDMSQAEGIFDLETLRSREQTIFTGTVKPLQTILVLERTFAADDVISFMNDGKAALNFYFSKEANDAAGTNTVITVNAGETTEMKAGDFGNIANTFLHAENADAAIEGHFKIEL